MGHGSIRGAWTPHSWYVKDSEPFLQIHFPMSTLQAIPAIEAGDFPGSPMVKTPPFPM